MLLIQNVWRCGKMYQLGRTCMFKRHLSVATDSVSLMYDDYKSPGGDGKGSPLVICHGMLGSRNNWTSIAKQINKLTGRRVLTLDARNHGDSPHTSDMSYKLMAADVVKLIQELNLEKVSLMGHSMGGRTIMMLAALYSQVVSIDRMIIVDISPLNQEFDVTSSNEWNMEHYFHCLKAVIFDQTKSISQARKLADQQLAVRISDPGLRAWLLMNMHKDPKTGEIGWKINIDGIHQAFMKEIARIKIPQESIPAYTGPCLFVGGSLSDYIPVSDHEEIKEIFPHAEFKYVEGAGHWVHSQKPPQFLDTILPFVKS